MYSSLQRKVYNDLGKGVLENAWAGFNTSLFAYGQTGSGKSWSIVGYGANKGMLVDRQGIPLLGPLGRSCGTYPQWFWWWGEYATQSSKTLG